MRIPETFRGLVDDLPLEIYLRNLPHWRQDGATYFVTFRLHDSVPESVLRNQRVEVRKLYRELGVGVDTKLSASNPHSEKLRALQQRHTRAIADILDEGRGSSILRNSDARAPVNEALRYHAENTCEVYAYVIMPNHVHALVRPLLKKKLEKIFQSVKAFSSRRIGDGGQLWQKESYDTIIRDEEHFWRAVDYIQRNPTKAKLLRSEYELAIYVD